MTDPIIDPSTLTEEQRRRIKDEHHLASADYGYSHEVINTLEWLFGKDFFEKGEKDGL